VSDLPPEPPNDTIRNFCIAVRYNATTKKEQLHESVRVHVPGGPVFTLHVGAPLVALLPKQVVELKLNMTTFFK
jgi:hypothetical protein